MFNLESTVSLTAMRRAAKVKALEAMAAHFHEQVQRGMDKELVAIPALASFVVTLLPPGKGAADNAEAQARHALQSLDSGSERPASKAKA